MLLNLRKLFKKYDLSFNGVIHVGASEGQERRIYKELGIFRQVWFEPIPEVFERLKKNLASNPQATAINLALGPRWNKIGMAVANNGGQSSSFLKPKKHLEVHPDIQFNNYIWPQMAPLDDVLSLPEYSGIDTKDFLFVCDTQGFEIEVLRGAEQTLPKFKALILEVNKAELYENCPMIEEIDEYLGERGFVRVETRWTPNAWGDALFVRKDLLKTETL